jgi:hypothetical protein
MARPGKAQSPQLDIGGTLDELNGASALRGGSDALACPNCESVTVTAESISTSAGWAGIGASIGEPASGTYAIGTNLGFYSAPRGNQYFRTLAKVGDVFKAAGLGAFFIGSASDYYDAFETESYFQANLNAGVGAAGLFAPIFAPIYLIPGSLFFILSTNYPGGPGAYNGAYSEVINSLGPPY